jgi:aryl-phospho-beta-D-glucosidase BglC (GH1 family)
MKKFFAKAKSQFQDFQDQSPPESQHTIEDPQPSQITPPSAKDVFRYRYAHGTNLGSVFVLEKWLSGSMFPNGARGDSEVDAVTASLEESGLDATKAKWEAHWRDAVSEQDFEWLVREARCNSIRLPIGYFTLGEEWCKDSPFESVGSVYTNAWAAVQELEQRARSWGIGILLDFHAVYGGANGEAHSGTSTGKAELWGHRENLERSQKALGFIANEVKSKGMDGVVGIQVCNEAVFDANGMYEWYDDVIREIGSVDESIPIYISDGWDLNRALGWANKRHAFRQQYPNPIVIDTHRYYTFSDADRAQAPQQIISRIPQELAELDGKDGDLSQRGEAQLIVGEWSCVLDGQTWSRVSEGERDGLIAQFGRAQSQRWQQRAGGSYFWTYKMDWMDGGDWGFAEQTKKSNIAPPPFLTLPTQEIQTRAQSASLQRPQLARDARARHEEYWNRTSPGQIFQHELYSEGWDVGFSDAQRFFTMRADGSPGDRSALEGGDKIGCLEIWVKKRLLESGQRGEFVWEWEQGIRAGIGAFYGCVGI